MLVLGTPEQGFTQGLSDILPSRESSFLPSSIIIFSFLKFLSWLSNIFIWFSLPIQYTLNCQTKLNPLTQVKLEAFDAANQSLKSDVGNLPVES